MQLANSEEQSVKITIEDRKRVNMAAEFRRENTVRESRRTDETKSFRLHFVQESCVRGALPRDPPREVHTPYEGGRGSCIWIATVRGRETGGDDPE